MSDEPAEKKEPPKRRSVARRVLRGLRNLLGVVVLLLVLVVAWLHTDSGAETLRSRIEARLGERVTTKATIGQLRFSLFSGISLSDVTVFDRDDKGAIVAGRAFVKPRLGEVLGGTIALDEVTLEHVNVEVRGRPDGTTNLTGIAKPSPPRDPNAKDDRRVVVRALAVRDVAVHVSKPDGAKIDVEGVALDGHLDTRAAAGTTSAELALAIAKVSVERPRELTLTVTEIATKATADLVGGRGPIVLGPTTAAIRVTRPEQKDVATKLSLPKLAADVTPERLTLALETLELAALSIATAKVEAARKADGSVDRVETARVTRLAVKAADVEALAGKPVLASDLTIEVDASGPAEAFAPKIEIASAGGVLTLRASLDLRDPKVVRYDASLTTKSLDVKKVYASEKVPPLVVGELALTAKGERKEDAPARLGGTLLLRDVQVRDVMIDAVDARFRVADHVIAIEELTVRALGQKLDASGTYRAETKEIDAELTADARVSELLARLRRAGVLSRPPSPIALALSLSRPVKVRVSGKVDGEMVVRVDDVDARIAGGAARASVTARVVRGDPAKDEKAIVVKHVDADVDLRAVSLAEIGRLRGKELPVAGRARGRVRVEGDLAAPEGEIDLTVDLTLPEDSSQPVGTLRAKGDLGGRAGAGRIDAKIALTNASGAALATVDVKGTRAGLAAPLAIAVDVPDRSLSDFAPLLAPEIREKLPKDARVALTAKVDGGARRTNVEADLTAHLAPGAAPITLRARAALEGPPAAASTAPLSWTLDADVPESELASLPLPPERRVALADVRGKVGVTLHAKGTRADAAGDLTITARGVARGVSPPLDARVAVALGDDATTIDLEGSLSELRVLEGSVRAALGGKGLVTAARAGALATVDPAVAGTLTIPERTMTEWSRLAPGARDLPGKLGGDLALSGHARDPELHLRLGYAGYPTLTGAAGALAIDARGKRERAVVTVKANDAITLAAEVSPAAVLAARKVDGGAAKVHASLDADDVPIASLLPDSEDLRASRPRGRLDARMTADATLVFRGDARELGELSIRGPLTVKEGAFQIPTTWRRVHDVSVHVEGDGDKIAIKSIAAKESDRDEPNRALAIDGAYAVRDRELSLHAKAHRVLLSGGSFGMLDAPKAALSADVSVRASLGGAVRRVVVDVNALDLDSGDRQPRAVQQEVLSLGDVIEVGAGVPVGKLPVASPPPPPPPRTAERRPEDKSLDVVVRIPRPIHVKQRPLELYAKGEVHLERYGEERVLSGKLEASDGSLLVGGRLHPLTKGEVRMTEEGPFLDLHFRREPHPAALRDLATAGGTDVYAHMVGPFGKQKISFSGTADGLFEGLAIENIGRVRVLSTPDAPAGQTPQLPLVPQIRQTAFMSANLPHLAFLDRMNTYADPNVSRFAYGRFENLEAERYSQDGTRRIRTTVRSRVIGQSDAEVEGSLLFRNDPRVVSGIGLLGGTRVGGGPTIFLEWSSAD
ncbi:MAG: hypothetical protein KIT84_34230 [Labilithrix sp.]|nr:hypothetical protein [Labilithrix sp.]MCW5816105.1 hypothetical protein [Labilithrix sp.]